MDARLRDRIRLDSIMCVMDASQIFAAPEMMELKLKQIAFADMLILNKADLVNRDEIDRIKSWLDEYFHRYRLVEATRGQVPLEILLSSGRFDPSQLEAQMNGHQEGIEAHNENHNHVFSTWSYETDEPLSLEALREAARKLPASIYRCKGVIHNTDVPKRRAILQVVGKRVDISLGDEWGDHPIRTSIVAIGAHGTIDDALLREKFDACIAGFAGREKES